MGAARISCVLAPIALIGGFVAGAARQPGSYSSVHDTISALAARGATDRVIMTVAFVVLGACHVVTAAGLRRPAQAVGGLATVLIAFAPQPAHGSSNVHLLLAGIGLIALAIWPVQDGRQGRWAAAGLVAILICFAVTLQAGPAVGLTERILTVAEALWPIVAVRTMTKSAVTATTTSA